MEIRHIRYNIMLCLRVDQYKNLRGRVSHLHLSSCGGDDSIGIDVNVTFISMLSCTGIILFGFNVVNKVVSSKAKCKFEVQVE